MGKITPRFLFAVIICGLFLLSAKAVIPNTSYGPNRAITVDKQQSYFIGFYIYSSTKEASEIIASTIDADCTEDITNPTASNPAPVTVQCAADIPAPDITVVNDEADNCTTNPNVAFVEDTSDGNSNPEVITRIYSVTDDANNSINVTQTITVDDTQLPTASNPSPVTVQCTADIPAPDITVVTDEADNCTTNPNVAFVEDTSDGNSNPEVITRTYSVTDDANNSINVTQTITIDDTQLPTASNPSPVTVQCTADIPAPDITVVNDEADNCITNPSVAFVEDTSDGNSNPEVITRTYSVTDDANNSINVTQTITIDDTQLPTASNPAPVTVQCAADIPAPDITVVNDEADNCTTNPIVDFVEDTSDGNSNPEVITRIYSVTDDANNSINVTQTITVDDTQLPTASSPAPVTVQCAADIPPPDITVVTDEADNCTTNPSVAFAEDTSDGNSNPEVITRTYSVTDDAKNSINVTQTITIDDTQLPTASSPAPVTVQCAADIPDPDITVVTDEADNCTINPIVAFIEDTSDGNSNPEVITRTYSVTDDAKNSINVTQTITIDDTQLPTASSPAPVTVQCAADIPAPDITVVNDEADNCTTNPIVAFVEDTSDGNSNPEVITRTYSVTDDANNSINVTQTITVDDTQLPTASSPAPVTVQCAADIPDPDITVVTDEADNCTTNPIVHFVEDTSDGNSNPEVITRTYSVTDDANNSINVTQTITVNDTQDPAIPELPTLTSECSLTVIPPTTTDNCDNIITGTTGITDLTFESSETIIWIFTDEAGNSTGPVEQEIIINNIAPVPDDETLPTKTIEGCQISSIEDLDIPTATDCEGQISGTLSDDFVFPYIFSGTQTIEWQFIDSQGNISTQEQEITLIPENVEGGTLTGTFESTDFENQIDISSCEEQISVELQLTGEIGTIIQWEKFAVNEGNWEVISDNDNFYTATFPVGALESTYYRVLIQVGTCTEYSDDFYIRALPTGAAPTVTNLDPEKQYCLGDKVNLLATSNYLGTQNAIPDSPGDFNEGQLNTKDLDSWLVDGKVGNFTAGGNAKKPRNWSGTNNHDFGGIEYDSQDGKFAIAQGNFYEVDKNGKSNYDGNIPTTLESPITDFSNAESATIDFDQAFYFANDDVAVIEISFDGGQNYETLQVLHAKGDGIKAWYNGQAGSSTSEYNFHNDNTSISLENYFDGRDLSSVRIRWSFTGTSDQSVWAMDNIFLNKKIPVQTDVEWTEGIGDPDEDPIVTGTTEAPISFIADTPGVHQYGGTALVNGCRTYSEEGTGLIEIPVSYAYAGEDIIFTPEECGQNTVQLNAYDNTKTANENISKKAYPSPPPGCTSCDAPGTQENGTWSWSRQEGTSLCITESFSNVNDPDATFTAGPGLYTLTWTLDNGCSSTISVEITECKQIDFDGIDDHVDFNDNYDLLGAFSLEVWVRPESIDGTRTIISKRDVNFSDTAKGYDLRITDGIVSFNWDKSGTINSSPYKIDTNRWYHIALTHSESGEYKIYVDGLLIKTVGGVSPGENSFSAILGTMDNNDSGVSSNHFNGWMDEIRIWNVELKPDQLHLMMNQRIEKVATNTITGEVLPLNIPEVEWNNLVGYYRMNDIACGNVQAYNNIGFSGKLKNITSSQERTAPLPYISEGAGTWHNRSTWDPSSTKFWTFPHDTGINGKPILWNIAKQNHDISSNNKDIKLLGLFSADQKQLVMNGEINNSGNELRITHYLELDGKIDLNGESQLVQTEGSILAEESSGIIERAQQGTANSFNYNYWTSPASPRGTSNNAPYTIKGVLKDGTTKDPQDISFGYDHTHADGNYSGNKRISTYWLYKFHGDANSYGHWRWIGHTGELKTGEGFTMKGTSGAVDIATQQNYIFLGKPHNGTITLNISNQENRLVGNPYPSAIDADQFIRDNLRDVDGGTRLQNVFNGALYFWDHFGFENSHVLREYVGGYATYTLAGGVRAASTDSRINATGDTGEKEPGRYIPVAQGFFVNSVLDDALSGNYTIDGGDITFKNSQRVFVKEASGNSQFLKPENLVKGKAKVEQAKFTADTRYKIRLNFNSPKGYHRQILVTADARTTNHFDLGYDAPLIDDNAEDMFWLVEKSEFVIQAVPDFNVDQKLPIGLKIAEEKEFSIEIGELENLPDHVNIYLLNTSDSTYHDLRKEAFKASLPAGEYMDLYEIVFHDVTSSREGKEPGQGPIDYLYSLENNEFIISNPELHKIDHINIYNIAGQLVDQHYGIPDIKEIHIPQKKSLSSGVYIVKIYTSIGDYAKKVIIRNN